MRHSTRIHRITLILSILFCCIALHPSVFAQDGVLIDYQATPPARDASAILELRSTNQGLLAPKLNLTNLAAAAPVTSPAEGLIVYNTNATTGKGYYYWDGARWMRLLNGVSTPPTGSGTLNYLTKWTPDGSTLGNSQLFDNGTNVGIATATPNATLDVRGNTSLGATFTPTATENVNILNILSGANATGNANGISFYETTNGFGMSFGYDGTGSGATNALRFYSDTEVPLFTIENGGEIGIGVTAPTQALDVDGQIRMRTGATAGYIPVSSADGTMTWTDPTTITASDNDWARVGGGTPALTDEIYHTGNVGIGTTNPDAKLDITSNVSFPLLIQRTGDVDEVGIEFQDDASTGQVGYISFNHRDGSSNGNAASIHLRSTEPTLGVILEGEGGYYAGSKVALRTNGNSFLNGGNVGINTTSPAQRLDVEGNIMHTGEMMSRGPNYSSAWMRFDEDIYGNSLILGGGGLTVVGAGESAANASTGIGVPGQEVLYLTSDGGIEFKTSMQNGWATRVDAMTIESAGDVGIGTTDPTTKLDVNGTVRIRGGSPNPGNVLTATSTNGTATWGNPSANVVYTQTTSTWEPNTGGDSWYNITSYTGWLSINSGDIITIHADWLTRMEDGSDNDDFYWRVFMDGTSGCSDLYHNEKGYYRPNESGSDHDNFKNATYMDYWVSNCTGQVRFILQCRNTGDDDWEVMDRTLIVRRN